MTLARRFLAEGAEQLVDAYRHLKRRMWVAFRADLDRAAQSLMKAGGWLHVDEVRITGPLHRRYQRCLRVIAALRRRLPDTPELERILLAYAPPAPAPVVPITSACRWCRMGGECCRVHGAIGRAFEHRRST